MDRSKRIRQPSRSYTATSKAEPLRDLVLGTLQLLEHTATHALGMNRSMHYDVGGEACWHRVGDTLAPKTLWLPHLPKHPGMRTLQIEELARPDKLPGKVVVTVQPSLKLPHGVLFDVNNEIRGADGAPGTAAFVATISEHWPRLLIEAKDMAERVLGGALA